MLWVRWRDGPLQFTDCSHAHTALLWVNDQVHSAAADRVQEPGAVLPWPPQRPPLEGGLVQHSRGKECSSQSRRRVSRRCVLLRRDVLLQRNACACCDVTVLFLVFALQVKKYPHLYDSRATEVGILSLISMASAPKSVLSRHLFAAFPLTCIGVCAGDS
jgi:hypothetical protein